MTMSILAGVCDNACSERLSIANARSHNVGNSALDRHTAH